jgi:hypothetical protein
MLLAVAGAPDSAGMSAALSPLARRTGYAAAAVALLYAAVSVYGALGGTALLSTVGGWVEDLAGPRRADIRSP